MKYIVSVRRKEDMTMWPQTAVGTYYKTSQQSKAISPVFMYAEMEDSCFLFTPLARFWFPSYCSTLMYILWGWGLSPLGIILGLLGYSCRDLLFPWSALWIPRLLYWLLSYIYKEPMITAIITPYHFTWPFCKNALMHPWLHLIKFMASVLGLSNKQRVCQHSCRFIQL